MQDSILNVNTVYKMKVREKIYRPIVNSIHLFFSPFNSQCKKFKMAIKGKMNVGILYLLLFHNSGSYDHGLGAEAITPT